MKLSSARNIDRAIIVSARSELVSVSARISWSEKFLLIIVSMTAHARMRHGFRDG